MKTVVITGGCGGFGYFLTEHYLTQGWRVVIVDTKDDWDNTRPYDSFIGHKRLITMVNIGPAFRYEPDLIIHCAEENNPNHHMMEHAIHSNLTFHWSVLNHAAKFGVRTIVPLWYELNFSFAAHTHSKDPWIQCMRLRDQLLRHFDIGNTLISPVYMPRLISPLSTGGAWGSLVKRFYDAAVAGNVVVETTKEEVANGKIQWTTPKHAVAEIVDAAKHRNRNAFFVPGNPLNAPQLLALIFSMYGKDSALIPTRGDFNIGTTQLIANNQPAANMVAEVCDEWTRQNV